MEVYCYYESLVRLNETLRSMKKEEVKIVEADDNLEDEDLLEMVNGGLIDYMIIDSHKGEFWAQIFDGITLYPEIKLRTEGRIGWAMRKNSPVDLIRAGEDQNSGQGLLTIQITYIQRTHGPGMGIVDRLAVRMLTSRQHLIFAARGKIDGCDQNSFGRCHHTLA